MANVDEALRLAKARGVLPTALDTVGIRESFTQDVLARSVFSACTTHASYLRSVEKQVEQVLQGRDPVQARTILKGLLTRAGYTPEKGFPGDRKLDIPPARPGSIRDLSSNARLDLILATQTALLEGQAMESTGNTPEALEKAPGWELVRGAARLAPRDWVTRWKAAGGRVVKDATGRVRLVALKADPIWSVLGDHAVFADALGVSHPPFAFRSGMRWKPLTKAMCTRFGLLKKDGEPRVRKPTAKAAKLTPKPRVEPRKALPAMTTSTRELSPRLRSKLEAILREAKVPIQAEGKTLSMAGTLTTESYTPPPPPPSRTVKMLEQMKKRREAFNCLLLLHAI